jgi:hypothetical protein
MCRVKLPPYDKTRDAIVWEISKAQVMSMAVGAGKIVYFAHSKLDYSTSRAAKVRSLIRDERPDMRLLDPSRMGEVWPDLAQRLGSHEAVYELVIECSAQVVALEHKGFVGRGVFTELQLAQRRGLPCYVVRDKRLVPVESIQIFDKEDYKRCYGRVFAKGEVRDVAA